MLYAKLSNFPNYRNKKTKFLHIELSYPKSINLEKWGKKSEKWNWELLQGKAHVLAGEHGRALIQKRFFWNNWKQKNPVLFLGDILKLIKKVDGAWWEGELVKKGQNNPRGWFPSNYVRELKQSEIDKLKKDKNLE